MSLILPAIKIFVQFLFAAFLVLYAIALYFENLRRKSCPEGIDNVIAFFHPHCSAGGGGERVLWKQIEALNQLRNNGVKLNIAIYTSDRPSKYYGREVLRKVNDRFSISITESLPLTFIHIPEKRDASTFKRFSLMAESIDTIRLAWFAVNAYTPHVFVDTTGCAFTFIVAKLARCKIVAYVHYPTISTDMLSLVWERRPTYNNASNIAKSSLTTYLKLVYYVAFALAYGFMGSLADLVMVNSTWTFNHISTLWRVARRRTHVLYPPCDTESLRKLPIVSDKRECMILSIGQFRPEKDHSLQIRAFANMRSRATCNIKRDAKLILVGSCRGKSDEDRVSKLQELARNLGISDSVEFVLNQPFPVLKDYFSKASIGIHTMWNEHFGIGVVEMMAAGLITIAHNSGGPKSDIITPFGGERRKTGYLASSEEEYAKAMYEALDGLSVVESLSVRRSAQESSKQFSDEVFTASFKSLIMPILK